MTVSSLVTRPSQISPNTSGWRGAPSKITVHHAAGVISADGLGSIFADPGRLASCNYGVGYDGNIICILEEEYHPWTSSSSWNDSAAVTLECSNSYAGGEWPVGDATWDATTSLLADICKRWGIDPYYDGTIYATFTEHRMFAATGCPGDYIHRRMEMLVKEVRNKMNGTGGEWVYGDSHYPDKWWYRRSDGSYPKNEWEKIDGEWYCFDEEGYMMTGWIWWANQWYYCKVNAPGEGKMLTGWQTLKWKGKSCKFYFDSSGAMYPGGFKKIKGKWYAFDENGVLVRDDADIVVGKGGVVTIV